MCTAPSLDQFLSFFQADFYIALIDTALALGTAVPVLLFTNFFTVMFLRRYNKSVSTRQNDKAVKRNETRLAIVGIFLSTTYTICVLTDIFEAMYALNIPYNTDIFALDRILYWYIIFFDLFTLSSPYLLLFLSSSVRAHVLSLFKLKQTSVSGSLIQVASTPITRSRA
jgi:hypothetical protein